MLLHFPLCIVLFFLPFMTFFYLCSFVASFYMIGFHSFLFCIFFSLSLITTYCLFLFQFIIFFGLHSNFLPFFTCSTYSFLHFFISSMFIFIFIFIYVSLSFSINVQQILDFICTFLLLYHVSFSPSFLDTRKEVFSSFFLSSVLISPVNGFLCEVASNWAGDELINLSLSPSHTHTHTPTYYSKHAKNLCRSRGGDARHSHH